MTWYPGTPCNYWLLWADPNHYPYKCYIHSYSTELKPGVSQQSNCSPVRFPSYLLRNPTCNKDSHFECASWDKSIFLSSLLLEINCMQTTGHGKNMKETVRATAEQSGRMCGHRGRRPSRFSWTLVGVGAVSHVHQPQISVSTGSWNLSLPNSRLLEFLTINN